jgi:methylmalonyl-CoA mutase N-terminal domain/subunit
MRDRFNAQKEKSLQLRFHTQTAGVQLTAQQPEVNVVRVTIQALAAILGGTQSLHTNSYDEALALPSEKAAKLALRTQQVIASESGVTESVDPFAGSVVIENLTDQLESKILELIAKIDDIGGAVAAIENGFQKREIENTAYKISQEIDSKERIVVGVNQFTSGDNASPPLLQMDPELGNQQRAKLAQRKKDRNNEEVAKLLEEIARIAAGDENLLPAMKSAIIAGATVGEISDQLRNVWGVHRQNESF